MTYCFSSLIGASYRLITKRFTHCLSRNTLCLRVVGFKTDLPEKRNVCLCRAPSERALPDPRVLGCADLLPSVLLCIVPRSLSSASKGCSFKTGTVTRSQTLRVVGRRTSHKQCSLTTTIRLRCYFGNDNNVSQSC